MATKLTYKELLVELRFIGHIPEDKIVDVKRHIFQDPNTWSTLISRELNGQSRHLTIEWLESVINQARGCLQNLKEYEQQTLLKLLDNSLPGITKLAATYQKDIYVMCKIEAVGDEVKDLVGIYNHKSNLNNIVKSSNVKEDEYYDE